MDLHYSQTEPTPYFGSVKFESPMDLHYSQTYLEHWQATVSLNPLWIYTTLKRKLIRCGE